MQTGEFYEELGARIRTFRKSRGFTQEDFALKLKLTRTSVVNIESGRQRVLAHTLASISSALEVPVTSLLPTSEESSKSLIDDALKGKPAKLKNFVKSALEG